MRENMKITKCQQLSEANVREANRSGDDNMMCARTRRNFALNYGQTLEYKAIHKWEQKCRSTQRALNVGNKCKEITSRKVRSIK